MTRLQEVDAQDVMQQVARALRIYCTITFNNNPHLSGSSMQWLIQTQPGLNLELYELSDGLWVVHMVLQLDGDKTLLHAMLLQEDTDGVCPTCLQRHDDIESCPAAAEVSVTEKDYVTGKADEVAKTFRHQVLVAYRN